MKWDERSAKAYARRWLLDQIGEPTYTNYVGFPAEHAIFERMLIQAYPKRRIPMTLFERDPEIFKKISGGPLTDNPNVRILNEDFDEWLAQYKKPPFEVDIAWLDYCGNITAGRLNSVATLVKDMPTNSLIATTFLVGREKAESQALVDLLSSEDRALRGELPPSSYLSRIRAVTNAVLPYAQTSMRVKVLPYMDTSPMILVVFKNHEDGSPVRRTSIEILPLKKD